MNTLEIMKNLDKKSCPVDTLLNEVKKSKCNDCGKCTFGYEGVTQFSMILSDLTENNAGNNATSNNENAGTTGNNTGSEVANNTGNTSNGETSNNAGNTSNAEGTNNTGNTENNGAATTEEANNDKFAYVNYTKNVI